MKKLKIYLGTSVIGGCLDKEFSEESIALINKIKSGECFGCISPITINELQNAPTGIKQILLSIPRNNLIELPLLHEVSTLAQQYLIENIVSENFREDALHIAFATVYQVDVLASWNFKLIVNFLRIQKFNSVNIREGYKPLEIRSPKELTYE